MTVSVLLQKSVIFFAFSIFVIFFFDGAKLLAFSPILKFQQGCRLLSFIFIQKSARLQEKFYGIFLLIQK